MKIINEILSVEPFVSQPPVLIDIGASGEINAKWKSIAEHSVCIAFDADDREFSVREISASGYKKLITINRIVTADKDEKQPFYLTASPFCSSLLEPDMEKLKPWIFQDLFRVDRKIELGTITINESLSQAGVNYIDWFKTDTQGTDLRLFRSLKQDTRTGILVAEFEPGIIDAYKGEDKLYKVMEEMEKEDFWLSTMDIKGTQRLKPGFVGEIGYGAIKRVIRRSPCWAEVTYLRQPGEFSERAYLLLFVFALLEKQWGFALEISEEAMSNSNNPIFKKCRSVVMQIINKERLKIPLVVFKRQFNKLFRRIND